MMLVWFQLHIKLNENFYTKRGKNIAAFEKKWKCNLLTANSINTDNTTALCDFASLFTCFYSKTFYVLVLQNVFYPLEKFFTPWWLQIVQILKLTTTILRCKRKKKAKSNASERISKPSNNYPHFEKWKTWIWCFNIRWPLSSSLIKKLSREFYRRSNFP